jgi:transposase
MLKYSLGIDISKKDFHACLSVIDQAQQVKVKASRKFANHAEGFKELLSWVSGNKKEPAVPLIVAMEATGVYYEKCAFFLFKAGLPVSVLLPNKAKKYMQSLGLKSKNDKIDANGLARMGAEQCLEVWKPMDDFFYNLRALTRHHQGLHELKTNVGNQLHADEHSIYSNKKVMAQLKKLVTTIEKEVTEIEEEIKKQLFIRPEIAEKVRHITGVKGIGDITAATILGETNGFALFKSITQLISFAGYDVVENQSGKHNGKTRISKKGNSRIRRILYMPALSVVRYDPGGFKVFFDRLYAKHHQKMKAYVAVQKKLLVLIFTLWKKNEAFKSNKPEKQNTSGNEETEPSFALAQ